MKKNRLNLGIVGCFQNGKSTLVNCMLDDKVARTGGEGKCVTSVNVKYVYGDTQGVAYYSRSRVVHTTTLQEFLDESEFPSEIDEIHVRLWKPILRYINIIDTPGFDANEHDTSTAMKALEFFDVAIVVIGNKALSQAEISILLLLKQKKIPFYVIMNCLNKGGNSWNPSSFFNEEKVKNVLSTLANKQLYPLSVGGGDVITRTNLLWFWYVSEQYMQESDIKREEIEDGITYYVNRNLKLQGDINAINKFLLENSRMLPVRQYFDNEDNWFFPFMFIRWNIEFESIVTSWDEKLKTIIKHCI